MAEVIVMPRQGNSVESCVLLKWRVQEGQAVGPKTVVADVETDKASFEVEAGVSGTVLKLVRAEGDDVPVMQPIAYVGQPGEALPAGAAAAPAAPAPVETAATPVPAAAPAAVAPRSDVAAVGVSPRARLLAASQGLDPKTLTGTGPEGRVIERDVKAALQGRPAASPAAREAARATGTALPAVGTGPGGRILSGDVGAAPPPAAPVAAAVTGPDGRTETKIKGIRKIIADRMALSLASTAQFTLTSAAPARRLQDLRARFKASDPALGLQGVTIGDLIAFAAVRTLTRFGFLNAHHSGDTLTEFQAVHLGIACDTPRGLMVPVVRHAQALSLKGLSDETKRLAEACRSATVKPDELSGSTFSLSNLGAFGVEAFTPVLNIPEVAILGVGGISLRPVQEGSAVVHQPVVALSLTIDHMVVDGAPAARFLKALGDTLAEVDLSLAL